MPLKEFETGRLNQKKYTGIRRFLQLLRLFSLQKLQDKAENDVENALRFVLSPFVLRFYRSSPANLYDVIFVQYH